MAPKKQRSRPKWRETSPVRSAPSSSSSTSRKSVLLDAWWLVISETDFDGKRLAVAGFNAQGLFTSAPIVNRLDAYTVETADGLTLTFQGFIDRARTHRNGIPPQVSCCFSAGFPYNWYHYANEPTSTTTPTSSCDNDEALEHTCDVASSLQVFFDMAALLRNNGERKETNVAENRNHDPEISKAPSEGVHEKSLPRKCSVVKDTDAMTGKMSSLVEASFESPPTVKSTGLAVKAGSFNFSPNISGLLQLKHRRQLGPMSQYRAKRIRVLTSGDSDKEPDITGRIIEELPTNQD